MKYLLLTIFILATFKAANAATPRETIYSGFRMLENDELRAHIDEQFTSREYDASEPDSTLVSNRTSTEQIVNTTQGSLTVPPNTVIRLDKKTFLISKDGLLIKPEKGHTAVLLFGIKDKGENYFNGSAVFDNIPTSMLKALTFHLNGHKAIETIKKQFTSKEYDASEPNSTLVSNRTSTEQIVNTTQGLLTVPPDTVIRLNEETYLIVQSNVTKPKQNCTMVLFFGINNGRGILDQTQSMLLGSIETTILNSLGMKNTQQPQAASAKQQAASAAAANTQQPRATKKKICAYCNKPSGFKCSCKKARYCSVGCQRSDRPTHEPVCTAVPKPKCTPNTSEIGQQPQAASAAVANTQQPRAATKTCACCNHERSRFKCSCKKTRYCSEECQRTDWPTHSITCTAKT